jgi:Family of unknown function (DUF6166)
MKIYIGMRSEIDGQCSVRYLVDGDAHELPLHLEIANHSPTGFEWGYGGSGPAQLAIALIADSISGIKRSVVLRLHQRFKWRVTAKLPRKGWRMTQLEVVVEVGKLLAEDGVKAVNYGNDGDD